MKFLLYIFFFISILNVNAQSTYFKNNIWYSLNWQHKISSKVNITTDAGYRTFDNFFNKTRTELARSIIDYKLNKNNFAGVGFAYFVNFSYRADKETKNNELRPFVQYVYRIGNDKSELRFRFRNESRYTINTKTLLNRSRLQIMYKYNLLSRSFVPTFSAEGFITPQTKIFYEQRYTAGLTIRLRKQISLYTFYTLQYQSNIKGAQNIIGIQLTLATGNND